MPDLFAILPYIRTTERVPFREIEFRSSSDLDGLPPEAQEHLRILCSLFYLQHGVRIKEMTCAFIKDPGTAEKQMRLQEAPREAHMLFAYLNTSRDMLPFENSTLFLFEEAQVPAQLIDGLPSSRVEFEITPRPLNHFVSGYSGTRNQHLFVYADPNRRFFPEVPYLRLLDNQDLARDLRDFLKRREHWAFEEFCFSPRHGHDEVRERVLIALEWHARSCRSDIDKVEATANLAVALESLLKVPEGKDITERFKHAVITLLGPVERLDVWLNQFYDARSKTLHEGIPRSLYFSPEKSPGRGEAPKLHRPLLEYGYGIFHMCLTAILHGAMIVDRGRLAASFVSNEERLKAIHKAMGSDRTAQQRLLDIAQLVADLDLGDYWISVEEMESGISAARAVLRTFQETRLFSPELKDIIEAIVPDTKGQAIETLTQMEQVKTLISHDTALVDDEPTQIVLGFLECVVGRFRGLASRRGRQPKKNPQD